jgi:hypothetical protein
MPVRPGVEAANLLINRYNPGLLLAAVEEMRVADQFSKPDGVEYLNNALIFRKIARHVASTLGSTATGASIDYNTNTETAVTASPTFIYSGVQVVLNTLSKMVGDIDNLAGTGKLMAAYKKQSMAALATQIDTTAAGLADDLGTNIVGSGAVNIDKALLLAAQSKLLTNARSAFKPGQLAYLCIHPSQSQYLMDIPEVTAANIRGDASNPNVKGWVWTAFGWEVRESGNILQSGGITHNLLFVSDAFAIGYNQRPKMLPLQDIEAYYNLIAVAEFGVVELFDEYAVDIRTVG